MDGTQFLTVQQAAEHFGVTEKTIRRRIADGKLNAEKVPTSQGYEWRITIGSTTPVEDSPEPMSKHVDTPTVYLDSSDVQGPRQTQAQVETAEDIALLRALELADRLQRENAHLSHENVQLAGQVGFLQAQVQEMQQQIKLLTVAKDEPPPPEPEPQIAAAEPEVELERYKAEVERLRRRNFWQWLLGR